MPKTLVTGPGAKPGVRPTPTKFVVLPLSTLTVGSILWMSLCSTSNARNVSLVMGATPNPGGNPNAFVALGPPAPEPVGVAKFAEKLLPRFEDRFVPKLELKL